MSTPAERVSQEVERMVAPLPALVYVAIRGPGGLRMFGTYGTWEGAAARCQEVVDQLDQGRITWGDPAEAKSGRGRTWKSQDLPWGRQLAAYYITESAIEE